MSQAAYKKYTEVYAELARYCRENPGGILPGERELARLLGASRMTLRKALELGEMEMLIRRGRLRTEILNVRTDPARYGKILYVGPGYNHTMGFGALARLYHTLSEKLSERGVALALCTTNELTSFEETLEVCRNYDVLLLSIVNCARGSIAYEQLRGLQREHLVIALSDPYVDEAENFAALDNHAAGRLAGEALIEAGCRRMVFISGCSSSIMFDKRRAGFVEALERAGLECAREVRYEGPAHWLEIRRKQLREAIASGCDGGFIASDEGIEFVTHGLWASRVIPERFKLLTLHGSGEALTANPPVCCLSHATDSVASAVVEYLDRYARNPNIEPLRKLLVPEFYYHPSIGGKIMQNKEVVA